MNASRYDTTQQEALSSAERVADSSGIPQTVYRNAETCGWGHSWFGARALTVRGTEFFVTILNKNFFC